MNPFGASGVVFRKPGRDIKSAIGRRCSSLKSRLERRNTSLDAFLDNRLLVRSYLIRSAGVRFDMHGEPASYLGGAEDISSEQMDEIRQLCQRILELEQELNRLQGAATHMDDDEIFELSYQELVGYGFEAKSGA